MTTELTMLALAVVLGLVQVALAAQACTRHTGLPWTVGPRNEPRPPVGATALRLERAFASFMETFPLFAAAVLVAG